jgi:hypothetical protein
VNIVAQALCRGCNRSCRYLEAGEAEEPRD